MIQFPTLLCPRACFSFGILLLVLCSASRPATAQLLAYEPWDLGLGSGESPIDQGGDSSFGLLENGWNFSAGNGSATYDVSGLAYTDSVGSILDQIPGAVSISSTENNTRWSRVLLEPRSIRPDSYYVSFLLRLDSNDAGDMFWTPDGVFDKGAAGLQTSNTPRFVNGATSGLSISQGETVLVVLHLDLDDDNGASGDGDEDMAEMWVNPRLDTPGAPSAIFLTGSDSVNRIRDATSAIFKFNAANSGAYTIDELRIGLSFESVTPNEAGNVDLPPVGSEPGYPPQCQQDLQDWLPYPSKVDLMAVTAHPDDEGIFFGGTLPYYTQVQNKSAILVGMTGSESNHAGFNRREELERAAWHYGVQYKPVNFAYPDVGSNVANTWEPSTGAQGVAERLATEIRRYRPDVLITHDFGGEYGHAAHALTATVVAMAYDVAADPAIDLDGLPVWQTQKLYIHLYNRPGDNNQFPVEFVSANGYMYHSWETAHAELGGATSRTIALEGLECHQDAVQAFGSVPVVSREIQGELFDGFHSEDWGLYATEVGSDTVPNDFFQNVPEPGFGLLLAVGGSSIVIRSRRRRPVRSTTNKSSARTAGAAIYQLTKGPPTFA